MKRISKPPAERKQEIVAAAKALFMSQGYEQTQVSDIVKRVGVAQGLFYYYFRSKQEVFVAVIDEFIQARVMELARHLKNAEMTLANRLGTLMGMLSSFFGDLEKIYGPAEVRFGFEPYAAMQMRVCEVLEPILTDLLREGTEQGILDAPYPERLGRFFIAGFFGIEGMPNPPQAGEMMDLIRVLGKRLLNLPDQILSE